VNATARPNDPRTRRRDIPHSPPRCYVPRVSDAEPTSDTTRQRLTTIFGWVAGGALGVLLNFVAYVSWGESYPVTWTTFALFLAGAFGGMHLADRLGPERGFRPLGIAAGVLFALFLGVILTVAMGGGATP